MNGNYFGTVLRQLRIEEGLSQRQLGKQLGVCNQAVSFWENGQREPDFDTLVEIAKYFNVSTDFLLGIED